MKALIDPSTKNVVRVTSWALNPDYPQKKPEYIGTIEEIPNSERVCEVRPDDQAFPVSEPLFWVDCPDDADPNYFYYDTVSKTVKPIDNAPFPT